MKKPLDVSATIKAQDLTWKLEAVTSESRPDWLIQSDKPSLIASSREAQHTDSDTKSALRYRSSMRDTTAFLSLSAQHYMPNVPFKDYYMWALSSQNTQLEAWHQLIGVRQTVLLAAQLVSDMLDEDQWQYFSHLAAPVNAYLVYEYFSDALALGLGGNMTVDDQDADRRQLLHRFNQAAHAYIRGEFKLAEHYLRAVEPLAGGVSIFRQSLSPHKHQSVAQAFSQYRRDVDLNDIEYAYFPLLIANLQTCMDMMSRTEGFVAQNLIRRGLLHRYQASQRLIDDRTYSLERTLLYSSYATMAIPIIGYYVEAVALASGLQHKLDGVVENRVLFKALYRLSVMIRLLNDVGTTLILQSTNERQHIISELQRHYRSNGNSDRLSLSLMLDNIADEYGVTFTRIVKDLRHGETNVALHAIDSHPSTPASINVFSKKLEYFSELYAHHRVELDKLLGIIETHMQDGRMSHLLSRCVRFNEKLYSHAYMVADGEFTN